jgi:hypothetical protein
MWATTFFLFFKKILATGLRAEFGFLGVTIRTLNTEPRAWGLPIKAALLDLFLFFLTLYTIWQNVDIIKKIKKLNY